MPHPLAPAYAESEQLEAELTGRDLDTTDHFTATRRLIDAHHPKRLRLSVDEVIGETPTTSTYRLRPVGGGDLPPFLAGQYVAVEHDGTNRAYAMSSSPTRLDHYDLTVRRVPGGRVSNALIDTVRAGDELITSGPQGTFHHNPLFHGDDVVFIAGGSGVVPAMSMIREILDTGSARRFHLVYGSRDVDDVIFRDELDRIAASYLQITVHHVIGDLITAERITAAVGPLAGRTVYVCGPQALYAYATEQLASLGHPPHRTRFEANGAPARPETQSHWPQEVDPTEQVTVSVGDLTFSAPRNRPLLDALEDNGVRPEAACRSGECSLCRIRVVSGDVHQAEEAKPRLCDAKFGYVHSCVAYPLTDVRVDLA